MKLDIANTASLLAPIAAAAAKVATVAHTHPDGDALGSSLAMCAWLESIGKEVRCIFPDPCPASLSFMTDDKRKESILIYSEAPEATEEWIKGCDLLVILDMNTFSRAGGLEDILKASPARKVLIDHHLNPDTDKFCLVASEQETSSTCELVYYILKKITCKLDAGKMSLECARSLMTGMTTDTNNFANSTWPSTLQMASELLERGVDRDAIVENINWHYGENRLRSLGMLLDRRMVITPEGAAYIVIYKKDLDMYHLAEGDTEGFVNIPLAIASVRLSILLKEDKGHFRVSLRSKKGTSAATCASDYFHGGGHENAAGGKLYFPADIPTQQDAEAFLGRVTKEFLGR